MTYALKEAQATIMLVVVPATGVSEDVTSPESIPAKVKHGEARELRQYLRDGTHARTYRNIRATTVRTNNSAPRDYSEISIEFEVMAHGLCTADYNLGFDLALSIDNQELMHLRIGRMSPFDAPNRWYVIRSKREIPNHVFEPANQVVFIANEDVVVSC